MFFQAIEETLVNAFYHKDYQQREPIEIRIYPNSIIFITKVRCPFPKFNTDEDRSFFEVELFIHRAFNIKQSIPVNLQNVKWDLEGINILLNGMVDKSELELAGGIVGNQASDQAYLFQITNNQYKMMFELLDSNQVRAIARGIYMQLI